MEIVKKLEEAKKESRTRKFSQTWDLIISLKDVDLKKPENRLNVEFSLPHGTGKKPKTAFIVESLFADAKKVADLVLTKEDIPKLVKDKKKLKKYAEEYDWWFGEAPLMPLIGKSLGVVLGSRGKMPKPIPPKAKIEGFISMVQKSVKIQLRSMPVVQVVVGNETMKLEEVSSNIEAVYNMVIEKMPKGRNSVKNVKAKLTMGKPVVLEMK